jgi:curved DNA-binding protein CbpA
MSSSAAGKFQDHYVVLGVDSQAEPEAIQAAYARFVEKNKDDAEKLESASLALEVLTDPSLRASFDRLRGGKEETKPKFSGAAFFDALARGTDLRAAVLCLLYDRRRLNPFTPSLSMRHIEGMMRVTTEELNFALWYLKQRSLIINDDKSSLQITVDGMDHLERNPPAPERVLEVVKPEAISEASSGPGTALRALNRALAKQPSEAPAAVSR